MRKINRDFSKLGDEKGDFSNETPRISVFPQDQSHWRIDWFGDIVFPDRSIRRKQPSVFLHLSRLIDDRFISEPSVLLSPQCTSPAKLQKRIWVSVGTLALLRVGDIWCHGQLALRPDYELEEFAGVQIDQESTAIVKAGLNLNDGGFLTVELLTQSQDDGWTVPISVLANDDGEVAPELMLECPDHGLRMRRATVFAFKRESEHVCAVVIESEPPHTKIFATTGHNQDEVWLTLRCAALDFSKGVRSDTLDSPLSELIEWVFETVH